MKARTASIIGIGMTPFGKHDASLKELGALAAQEAIQDAGIPKEKIEALYVGNYLSGLLMNQEIISSVISSELGLSGIPTTKVEGACAGGGIALRHAQLLVSLGVHDVVLVVGVEKMTSVSTAKITSALTTAMDTDSYEVNCGLTFPGFFGAGASVYKHRYGLTREQLAAVSLKNRSFATKNLNAQLRTPITKEEILQSKPVAEPLHMFDCCPISDGAAAIVVCAKEIADQFHTQPIDILACAQTSGVTKMQDLDNLVSIKATKSAAEKAYQIAGLSPEDIQVAEVHDCFTMAEIIASEDLGFFEAGSGAKAVEQGKSNIGGEIVINPSGGLLSKGHPVGATGLAQIYEITRQLRGTAFNQVSDVQFGMTHNLGGTGAACTVSILGRGVN